MFYENDIEVLGILFTPEQFIRWVSVIFMGRGSENRCGMECWVFG